MTTNAKRGTYAALGRPTGDVVYLGRGATAAPHGETVASVEVSSTSITYRASDKAIIAQTGVAAKVWLGPVPPPPTPKPKRRPNPATPRPRYGVKAVIAAASTIATVGDIPGARRVTRNRHGATVASVLTADAGIDTGTTWAARCLTHGNAAPAATRRDAARMLAVSPSWCAACGATAAKDAS